MVPPASRGTIVIAEDDVSTRLVLQRVLTRENFRVVAVENGKLACEAVRRERPDVVLLDWLMPVMDGRSAVHELRAQPETRGIPIVMLTSHSEVNERIIALEAGVQDFLSKPFDTRELVASIEQQLRWRDGITGAADVAFLAERDALRAAGERRHRLLAEAMPHIVWIADADGRNAYFNSAWYAFTACAVDGFDAAAWSAALDPDDVGAALAAWSTALEAGLSFELQCRVRRHADGMYRWHVVRATPTRDETGAIAEWVGSCLDIHDYKVASETRAILDAMGNIIAIRTADGFIDYASPFWSEYTGSSVGSALGFGWRDFVHPSDLAVVDASRAAFTEGVARSEQFEMRLRGRDGVYRWFLSQTTMLPSAPDAPPRWLDTATGIHDLKSTQAALAQSEARYRALSDSMPQLVWVTGPDGSIEYVNRRWSEFSGSDVAAACTAGPAAVVHPEDQAALGEMRECAPDAGFVCEARFRRRDGVYRWHAVQAVPFDESAGEALKWIGTATDIEDSKVAAELLAAAAARLEHLAHHDPMTNLPNRTLLAERLTHAIAVAKRAQTEVIVLYLDLDRFKLINDTRGHAAGDRVLAVTGERIADALRAGDTASRVGGDEFVLVCATAHAGIEAARIAARLLHAIGQPIALDDDSVSVGASIGISMYPADGTTGEELIRKADSAMYAAKQSGRNLFRIFRADAHSSIIAALDFEAELQTALTRNEIVVHYQPILSLHTNRLIGAEALVRWQHPRRGLLPPAEFLPFADAHRLFAEIGAIVLDAVCARIAALGPNVHEDFRISMNVSARQLVQPGWVEQIAAALQAHGANPRRLQIELAESIVMAEPTSIGAILDGLRALGVSLSIDDFGTGLSSLNAIKNFPLHTLKIDRSFVAGIATNVSDQAVAKAIITLAHSLGLNVIAAGVETKAQADALRGFGSDAFQGFLASRAMTEEHFAEFLRLHAAYEFHAG